MTKKTLTKIIKRYRNSKKRLPKRLNKKLTKTYRSFGGYCFPDGKSQHLFAKWEIIDVQEMLSKDTFYIVDPPYPYRYVPKTEKDCKEEYDRLIEFNKRFSEITREEEQIFENAVMCKYCKKDEPHRGKNE